jgi:hypothetical protein
MWSPCEESMRSPCGLYRDFRWTLYGLCGVHGSPWGVYVDYVESMGSPWKPVGTVK